MRQEGRGPAFHFSRRDTILISYDFVGSRNLRQGKCRQKTHHGQRMLIVVDMLLRERDWVSIMDNAALLSSLRVSCERVERSR